MDWFFLALFSALFSAAAAIYEKKSLLNLDAYQFSFVVSVFNMIFSLPFFYFVNLNDISFISLAVLFGKSILGALSFLCVMISLKKLEISKALPLLVLTPGLVAVFAFILLGESLKNLEVLGMFFLLVGTYILETKNKQQILDPFKVFFKSKDYRYIIYALLLFTITSIIDKVLLNQYKVTPYAFVGFQHIFMAVIFAVIFLFYRKKGKTGKIKSEINTKYLSLIIIVALLTVSYRYTQIEAFKIAPIALVLAIKRISVFFAAVIGGRIFKETNLLVKAIATAIMIAGAILIACE